jgi:hypothetical protein
MNIVKNMEVIFVAALVVAGFTTYATANERPAAPTAVKVDAQQEKMVTIVVSTKRLTQEEKTRLGS